MTTALTDTVCVACGNSNSRVFWSDKSRTIRKCQVCKLLFVFPQPDQANLHREFQSDYFAKGRQPGETRLELEFEQWRRPTLSRVVERILRLKPGGKLLDVGCASGEIFEHFRNGNWDLYGVEPSAMAFQRAEKRFGDDPRVHLFNAYLGDVDLRKKTFDVIAVLESLYYMPNPRRELSCMARLLKDDGILAIAVPGYAYQRLRHSGPINLVWHGSRCSLTPSHLFYFSENSLGTLLGTEGFRIFDTIQLSSSSYGSGVGRFARQTYLKFSKALVRVTLGQINLAPHVLYLCQKSDSL